MPELFLTPAFDEIANSNCALRTYMSNYSVMAEANKIPLFEIEFKAHPGLFSQIA
jgi:hypothetical protein